jgi:carbonic anhydrase/acetyltransferase-like protein (isoleucine patch superfamily)
MPLLPFRGVSPNVHPSVFLAEGARIIGDVEIGEDSSVWFNSVLRGDVHFIRVGKRTNIQDLCVLHVTRQKHACVVGDEVTVGHHVTLHGCTVRDGCLIGMGSVVMDAAEIGEECLVAAGSLVVERFQAPPRSLVLGAPAKVVRPLTPEEVAFARRGAGNYVRYVRSYCEGTPP